MSHLLDDPFLKPFEAAIRGRAEHAFARARELAGRQKLSNWASAHEYYGLHRVKGKAPSAREKPSAGKAAARREKPVAGKAPSARESGFPAAQAAFPVRSTFPASQDALPAEGRSRWVFREWAPNATSMWLVGDFSNWKIDPRFECFRIPNSDVWQMECDGDLIRHGQNYRLEMRWEGGHGERIPAYARYVVQDPETHLFSAQVYESHYKWKNGKAPGGAGKVLRTGKAANAAGNPLSRAEGALPAEGLSRRAAAFPAEGFSRAEGAFPAEGFSRRAAAFPAEGFSRAEGAFPLIYEAHVGMATEEKRVGTYAEFRDNVLPRIKKAGYNVVQLMGIMEHPYYGSFGYHVSSFYAASSRFGTPDDLKSLIDTAHGMGLRVIMDLVHSHAVKNERDGLSLFDGTDYQYFHSGAKGWHSAWDSRCFDYGKTDVLHFLLSNCRFWLDEYRFDGYRFDGVTSMLYWDHGLGTAFSNYAMYFNGSMDDDAWCYLQMANRVIHESHPDAITIAEDVSGMPGCAAPAEDCGIGFDYRMAMGEPDFWFKLAEKTRDDDWPMGGIYYELTNRRREEKVVSYVESHDQALVGGKTFFFTLADAAIYFGMAKGQNGLEVDRAIALHKMARLATCALSGGAYLNFMGNEFGHPEWIDFPRAENGWDYSHARRQWSLRDDPNLRFKGLADFDETMLRELAGNASCDAGKVLRTGKTPSARESGFPAAQAAFPVRSTLPANGLSRDAVALPSPIELVANEPDKVLAFVRGNLLFVFNFNPTQSFEDYGILVPPASDWRHLFDTDEPRFGGQGRIAPGQTYAPSLVFDRGELVQQVKLYLPARTATVLKRV